MADTDRDLSAPGSQCVCQQSDVYNLRRYINSEDKLIGTFCTKCKTERLINEYSVSDNDDENTKDYVEMQEMLPRPLPNLSEITAFQVRSSETKVDLKHFADILKPGDQICWHNRYFFWHHAIVSEVIAERSELMLIHWNTVGGRIQITCSRNKVDPNEIGLFDKMYRIDYSEEITKANDQELVLARARSRIGDTGYFPFIADCETFATYCETGVEKSHRLAWLKGKCKEIVRQNIVLAAMSITKGTCRIVQNTVSVTKQTIPSVMQDTSMAAGKIFPAEGIEYAIKVSNFVGAGIVIVLESGFVTWDLNQAYKERKKGNISRNDFIETAIRRLVEGVLSAGMSILCSLGPELIGIAVGSPLGPAGIIIGGIVGGVVGGVVGKMAGTALGSVLGKAISSTFKADVCNHRYYENSENKLIGTFCTKCKVQKLIKEYVVRVKDDEDTKDSGQKQEMLSRPLPNLSEITAFQVRSSKTKVDLKHFADILIQGDQICWHRRYLFWHHAIVSEVIAETSELMLIQCNKEDNRIKIIRSRYNVDPNENELFNKMYRIDYSGEITKANDQELVLARARSRIDDTGYFPFTDDCETFATYCKTGVEKSHQLAWLKGKCKEIIGQNVILAAMSITKGTCRIVHNLVSIEEQTIPSVMQDTSMAAGEIVSAEGIEHAMKGSNFVGAGIVIVLEAGFVTWDLNQAYKERKKGNTSRNYFIETAIRRLVEGVLSAGMSILCFVGPEFIGIAVGSPLGPAGIIIGGIVGGVVGGVVGKMAGTALGSVLGKAISSTFKADDRAVSSIADLNHGDHIVVYGWVLHPRCHAIVVDHNGVDKIKVIRNSYKSGVVEECIPFSNPLFKVEYQQGTCKDPEKVVEMARSKLGENQYSLAIYNCKTFARQCKYH